MDKHNTERRDAAMLGFHHGRHGTYQPERVASRVRDAYISAFQRAQKIASVFGATIFAGQDRFRGR